MFGSKDVLSRVKYLNFETHRDIKGSAWSKNTLGSVIKFLDELNFTCYWTLNTGKILRVTGCFMAKYEERWAFVWGNIAC